MDAVAARTLAVIAALMLFSPSSPVAQEPSASTFSAESLRAFGSAVATHTVAKGENLQRVADAAYGNRLYWPMVWVVNADTLTDPELVSVGAVVRVARLAEPVDQSALGAALDEAYRLTYRRYRELAKRTPGERRWVLSQAFDAGVDVRRWGRDALGSDERWASSLEPGRAIAGVSASIQAASIAKAAAEAAARSGKASREEVEAFIKDAVLGTPLPALDVERLVARIPSGELAAFAERLEAELDKDSAAPQVALALAYARGRLGLKAGEYAALAKAAELSRRSPGVVFNVFAVHGRMELLRASADWADIERGLLASPAGATAMTAAVEPPATAPLATAPHPTAAPPSGPSATVVPSVPPPVPAIPSVRTRRFMDVSGDRPRGYYSLQEFREGEGYRETGRGYDDDALAFHEIATDAEFRTKRYVYRREDQGTDVVATLTGNRIVVKGTYMGAKVDKAFATKGLDWVVDQVPYLEAMARKGVASNKFLILIVDQPGGLQVMEYRFERKAREALSIGTERREAWKVHWGLTGMGALAWPGADYWFDAGTGEFLRGIIPIPGRGLVTFVEDI